MKRIVLSAAALMLASAFSFAGTPETKAKPEVNTNSAGTLHWYKMSGSTPVFQNTGTQSDEQALTGCDGAPTKPECERGYRDDQLNSPGNPSAGIKPAQVASPDTRIYDRN